MPRKAAEPRTSERRDERQWRDEAEDVEERMAGWRLRELERAASLAEAAAKEERMKQELKAEAAAAEPTEIESEIAELRARVRELQDLQRSVSGQTTTGGGVSPKAVEEEQLEPGELEWQPVGTAPQRPARRSINQEEHLREPAEMQRARAERRRLQMELIQEHRQWKRRRRVASAKSRARLREQRAQQ